MREAGPNPALSRNCEWGAFGRRPLRRSPWEGGRDAVIHKPGDPFLERTSHLRGSVGMPPAARFPCPGGWLPQEDRSMQKHQPKASAKLAGPIGVSVFAVCLALTSCGGAQSATPSAQGAHFPVTIAQPGGGSVTITKQ